MNSDPTAQPLERGGIIGPILSDAYSFLRLELRGQVGRLQLLSAFTSGDFLIE